ncbi:hypothetical protein GCM10009768_25250 [Leucobacter iarius]|uniref:Uncharacterized protein n=1 Tax=Leucobacter iarius TaxID=333963 RepID=A0ABN2LRL5_9MICO
MLGGEEQLGISLGKRDPSPLRAQISTRSETVREFATRAAEFDQATDSRDSTGGSEEVFEVHRPRLPLANGRYLGSAVSVDGFLVFPRCGRRKLPAGAEAARAFSRI